MAVEIAAWNLFALCIVQCWAVDWNAFECMYIDERGTGGGYKERWFGANRREDGDAEWGRDARRKDLEMQGGRDAK